MTYSRKLLHTLHESKNSGNRDEISQTLVLNALEGKELTLAEEYHACNIIALLRTIDNQKAYDISKLDCCKNYRFKHLYMLYFYDLNGYKKVVNAVGEIPYEQKQKDVDYLNSQYLQWQEVIKDKQNGDGLLNFISKETTEHLNVLRRYCRSRNIGSHYHNYLKKSLTLHGKQIYNTVKEFYQEVDFAEQILEIGQHRVLLNSYSYVHILFRHYAGGIKQYQNKSYHFNQLINFKEIPLVLYEIINSYSILHIEKFNGSNLFLKINGQNYAIWFKLFKRSERVIGEQRYLRVETFYPIELERDFRKLSHMELQEERNGYAFYI